MPPVLSGHPIGAADTPPPYFRRIAGLPLEIAAFAPITVTTVLPSMNMTRKRHKTLTPAQSRGRMITASWTTAGMRAGARTRCQGTATRRRDARLLDLCAHPVVREPTSCTHDFSASLKVTRDKRPARKRRNHTPASAIRKPTYSPARKGTRLSAIPAGMRSISGGTSHDSSTSVMRARFCASP